MTTGSGPHSSTIIGVDVGGTKTAVVEATRDAVTLQSESHATRGDLPFAETFPSLAALIRQVLDRARASGRTPAAISIVSPGPLHAATGVIVNPPNLPGWHGVHLTAAVEEQFPGLPVYLEHDAKAGALAEWRFGAARGRPDIENLIFLVYGTGMGAGIIIQGRLLRGASETAGELATLRVPAPDDAVIPRSDGWESVASGRGLVWLGSRMFPSRWTSETPIAAIVGAALAGDVDARAVVTESGRWLGSGMAMLTDVLNPQLIVVGSLAVVLGDLVLGPARDALRRYARPAAVAALEVVPAALGERLSAVQSVMPALEKGVQDRAAARLSQNSALDRSIT
jgi:glucokinase